MGPSKRQAWVAAPGYVRNRGILVIAAISVMMDARVVSAHGAVRRVVMVAYPAVQILDVTGPLEVFARTARWLQDERHHQEPAYTVEVVATSRGLVRASSGLRLFADRALADVRGSIDTLIVAGGIGAPAVVENGRLIDWLR